MIERTYVVDNACFKNVRVCVKNSLGRCFLRTLKSFHLSKDMWNKSGDVAVLPKSNKFQGFFNSCIVKDKDAFLKIISEYKRDYPNREYIAEFIYAALENMHGFGVNKDYSVYESIIHLFPPDSFLKCKTVWMKELRHFPKHQDAAVSVLSLMEYEGVIPESSLGRYLIKVFGDWTYPVLKIKRMIYWLPKFKHANPYSTSTQPSNDRIEMALSLLRRISIDPRTQIRLYQSEDNKSWYVSAQSTSQQQLLSRLTKDHTLYIEGPHVQWIDAKIVEYFIFRASASSTKFPPEVMALENDVHNLKHYMSLRDVTDSKPKHIEQHELNDGLICGFCVPSCPSLDLLSLWLHELEEQNSNIRNFSVIFTERV